MITSRKVEMAAFVALCVVLLLTVRPFSTSSLPVSITGILVDGQSGLSLEGVPIRVSVVEDGERALADLEITRSGEGGAVSYDDTLSWPRRLGPIRRFNRGDPWAGTLTVTIAPSGYEARSIAYPFGPLLARRKAFDANLGQVLFSAAGSRRSPAGREVDSGS